MPTIDIRDVPDPLIVQRNGQQIYPAAPTNGNGQPPPVITGGLFNPRTGVELQQAGQLALDQGYMLLCDPRARPIVNAPVILKARDRGTQRHGIAGNGMQLCGGPDMRPTANATPYLMTVELDQLQNRHLLLDNIAFDDRRYEVWDGRKAHGLLIKSRRAVGENGLYQAQLVRLVFEACDDGLTIDGYAFESLVDAPEATNCDRGIVLKHDAGNVLSNIIIQAPLLRMSRIGIQAEGANSIMVRGGSFISLEERSIAASNGMKQIDGADFENGGNGFAIDIPTSDFGMSITNCTGSNTMGNMPNLIRYRGDPRQLFHQNNRVLWQGTGTFTEDSTVQ